MRLDPTLAGSQKAASGLGWDPPKLPAWKLAVHIFLQMWEDVDMTPDPPADDNRRDNDLTVNFRVTGRFLPDEIQGRLQVGESPGTFVRSLLEDFFTDLRTALDYLQFTEAESSFLCDALGARRKEYYPRPLTCGDSSNMWRFNVEMEAKQRKLGEKWGVDLEATLAKIERLTYFQALALRDAAWRFWRVFKETGNRREALVKVGLLGELQPELSP